MGKNQQYKAMQRSRSGASSGGPDEIEDGLVDGSFHSPEWHAARLASLKTSHTVTWEEYKKKQKEDEIRKGELEADKDKMMREYRAQLDAERAIKLAKGRNHSGSKSSHRKDKEKDLKKHSTKRKKTTSTIRLNIGIHVEKEVKSKHKFLSFLDVTKKDIHSYPFFQFGVAAYLQQIWWFEIDGEVDFPFPPGKYSVFYKLQLGRTAKRLGRRIYNTEHVRG